jgi:uncharacterized protein
MSQRLIILGASARAAAASARRAGFEPWTADLFADADLRAMVPATVRCPIGDYPGGFREILRGAADAPWIYTGGLENHPNLIRDLSEIRPLWGNGPNVLTACRSPFRVERLLREAGFPTAEVRAADAELPDYCRWLRKPLKGSGGQGIDFATKPEAGDHHFYQQYLDGPSYSGVYVHARGETRLLGVTEQLIGPIRWLNAQPFKYAGNVGPVELGPAVRADLTRIGEVLVEACHLRGVFGADFILHHDRPHVIEINPRYTASIEVLERSTGVKTLGWHRTAFDDSAVPPGHGDSGSTVCAKAVLYASQRVAIPRSPFTQSVPGDSQSACADVPSPGEVIEPGWPILTILSDGDGRKICVRRLKSTAYHVQAAINNAEG